MRRRLGERVGETWRMKLSCSLIGVWERYEDATNSMGSGRRNRGPVEKVSGVWREETGDVASSIMSWVDLPRDALAERTGMGGAAELKDSADIWSTGWGVGPEGNRGVA